MIFQRKKIVGMESFALAPHLGSDVAALVTLMLKSLSAERIQAVARGMAVRRWLRDCEVCEGCEELVHCDRMCGDQCRFYECCNVCAECCYRLLADDGATMREFLDAQNES